MARGGGVGRGEGGAPAGGAGEERAFQSMALNGEGPPELVGFRAVPGYLPVPDMYGTE